MPPERERLRVLHLLGTRSFSGAENVIITMMEMFENSQFEMVYCSPEGPIRGAVESRGLTFLPLSSLTPGGLWSVLKRRQFDVVHAHDFKASVVAALVRGLGFRGRIVAHIHSDPELTKSWNPFSIVFRLASVAFSRVVFVSAQARATAVFARAIASRSRVIPNVVDVARVLRLAAETDMVPTDVVFVGRLVAVKQPQVVLRAVSMVRERGLRLSARLVGEGELRDICEDEIERLGLEADVRLDGFQTNPYPAIRAGRVALMPSTVEGLGLVALECLALGVPVLNSGAGGLGDIFRDHPEFVCRSVGEYADRLLALRDPVTYEAYRSACADIVAPFGDLDAYRRQITELYA